MKVKPWMLGVGVVAVGGVGIALYELTAKKAATAPGGPALPVGAHLPPVTTPAAPAPFLPVTRPDLPVGSAIFGTTVPPGPVLTLLPGATMGAIPTAGQNITLALPLGATWTNLVAGNTANSALALGQVNFGSDLKSAVSVPVNALVGSNLFLAVWKNGAGAVQHTYVTFPTVVAVKPLHF